MQNAVIPMDASCASPAADCFFYERNFIWPISDTNKGKAIVAFNPTSRYLDDLVNINNP